jgi:hypothetical protein
MSEIYSNVPSDTFTCFCCKQTFSLLKRMMCGLQCSVSMFLCGNLDSYVTDKNNCFVIYRLILLLIYLRRFE